MVDMERYQALLQEGVTALEPAVALTAEQQQLLLRFLQLLEKWNRTYNLTSITEWHDMVVKHVLDSIVIAPYLRDDKPILDVGTGAGIPGIPLAIAKPNLRFILLDSNNKKIRFIKQVLAELNLTNVVAVHSRIEQFHPEEPLGQIMCRAYSSMTQFIQQTVHLRPDTESTNGEDPLQWLALKGVLPAEEIDAFNVFCEGISPRLYVQNTVPLSVPFLHEQRHLVQISTQYSPTSASIAPQ